MIPTAVLIICAIIYGVTMKVADLLDEHGLKWFKYSNILFGFLWGIAGVLVILLSNPIVVSTVVAMNIAFIVRNRLDFLNHQIAATLIIVAGIISDNIVSIPFLGFLIVFLIFGALKDQLDDVIHVKGMAFILSETMLYYPIPTFLYCLFYGNWILFWIFATYTVAYDLTKLIYNRSQKRN
ncbi:hypothetical protein HY091_03025 [Candidatus Kaiserbacteria bacterium]|nr:hypothetical protein [Candidatus Kaiserbacteria bacterium]